MGNPEVREGEEGQGVAPQTKQIVVPAAIHKKLREIAVREDTTILAITEEILRRALEERELEAREE